MDQNVKALHRLAVAAINERDFTKCEALSAQILDVDSQVADAWFLRAMSFLAMGKLQVSLANLLKALKLEPTNPEYLGQFAKLCLMVNEPARAGEAARRVLALCSQDALTLDTVGVVLTKLADYESAYNALKRAVEICPDNSQFNFNLASAAHFIGNESEAETYYLEAIALNPKFARAYWALSELYKNRHERAPQTQALEALLEGRELNAEDELYLCHTLARIREDEGRFVDSFKLLNRGKRRFGERISYSWEDDQSLFNSIKKSYPLVQGSPQAMSLGEEAIFVLGMPRSGTTLVDRILSTHSSVQSLGELQNFALVTKQLTKSKTASVLDEDVNTKMNQLNLIQVGQAYLSSLINRDRQQPKFVDKTPLNFLQLGLICESLPAAKIILVRRNAMDTCLSNFRQLFAVSFSYYNYQYSLKDTANYYRLFDDLMAFWAGLYGDRIHTVNYEDLLDRPESESKKMLEHCGLEWEEQCLRFYENKAAVATASAMQVREPIYKTSVARWKKYESQLQDAKLVFDAAGIKY
ncbi:tetratricopeptide repeat-containing sulfotransferase family protein [Arenicella sp. 4NH20-0111]|uniref:tetratricopeptide repeat-containing sulfotransferase family protein n=1 Tax=Arenicella sp. 4NH20-0111 TaxID=3127648 RepID=UPI0031059693